jgi:hypothetical protein
VTSPVIVFPFDQLLLHREFPHGGGFPSPTDFARKVEAAHFAGGGVEGHL